MYTWNIQLHVDREIDAMYTLEQTIPRLLYILLPALQYYVKTRVNT